MRRLLTPLLCIIFLFALSSCGESKPQAPQSSSGTQVTGDQSAGESNDHSQQPEMTFDISSDSKPEDTDAEDIATSTTEKKKDTEDKTDQIKGYDPALEHKIIATDITNHSLVVFDLNVCEGDWDRITDEDLVVWEWDADEDPNCSMPEKIRHSISGVKFRYSAYYEKDVVVACATYGWVGVIDYENCSLLWECDVGYGPHSVEMLPNGDVVVGASFDPGAVYYIPLSSGITEPVSSIDSIYCHGVCWDPDRQWIWVLEDTGMYAATIKDMGTEEGTISRIAGTEVPFGEGLRGGHALSPVYGEPGKYWVSAHELWVFDTNAETLNNAFRRADSLSKANIKGIASFSDETVVESIANLGKNSTRGWSCDALRVVTRELSAGKVQVLQDKIYDVIFDPEHREFYKIQPFTKKYQ